MQYTEKSPANSFSEGVFSRQCDRKRGRLRVPRCHWKPAWPLIFFLAGNPLSILLGALHPQKTSAFGSFCELRDVTYDAL